MRRLQYASETHGDPATSFKAGVRRVLYNPRRSVIKDATNGILGRSVAELAQQRRHWRLASQGSPPALIRTGRPRAAANRAEMERPARHPSHQFQGCITDHPKVDP